MRSRRLTSAALMLALAACSRPASPPAVLGLATESRAADTVATFEGSYQPGQGLTIRTVPAGTAAALARVEFTPYKDGISGSGPDNTFELVTEASPVPGADPSGCGAGAPDFHGNITLRSFFRAQSFTDVAIELLQVSTGYEACLDDTPGASSGMSGSFGFWDYGPIGIAGSATRTWRFKFGGGQAFTFTGRIMAQLDPLPVPANGATAFEWAPSMSLDPPHSFRDIGTTRSHVVWNGANGFTDTVGTLSFQPSGSPGWTFSGLSYPWQAYASGFTASNYFVADAAHGGNSVDTSGDFTVCAKFKPGANPADGGFKVLVSKGNPVDGAGTGWALAHFRIGVEPEYSLVYRTGLDGNATRAIVGPQSATPDQRAYDYICGGRDGGLIYLDAFGQMFGNAVPVTGTIPSLATLPMVIGAAAGGAYPDSDGGVYEVIWDSRAISAAVAGHIIASAEGRATHNGAYHLGFDTDGPTVPGADLAGYLLPRGAGAPLTTDGSGLLDAGTRLTFNQVLQADPASGSCFGVEVAAANWAAVGGDVLGESGGGRLKIFFEADTGQIYVQGTNGDAYRARGPAVGGWAAGSRHKFKVCSTPHGTAGNVSLYVDSSATPSLATSQGPLVDLSSTPLLVGTSGFGSPLTGARIGRVFACPSPTPGSCN